MYSLPRSYRIGVWIDGEVVIKMGDFKPKNIVHLLSVGRHQLLIEGRHSIHLPGNLGFRGVREVLEWTEQALPPTANDFTIPTNPSLPFREVRPEFEIGHMIEFYLALRGLGSSADIQSNVANRVIEAFRNSWLEMDQLAISRLSRAMRCACNLVDGSYHEALRDPVVSMVAHTFAYGIQHRMFPDMDMLKHALRIWATSRALRKLIEVVGVVRYPIRSFVATPVVYALPGRRVGHRTTRNGQGPEQVQDLTTDMLATASVVSPGTISLGTISPDTLSPDTLSPDTLSPDTLSPDTLSPAGSSSPADSSSPSAIPTPTRPNAPYTRSDGLPLSNYTVSTLPLRNRMRGIPVGNHAVLTLPFRNRIGVISIGNVEEMERAGWTAIVEGNNGSGVDGVEAWIHTMSLEDY